MPAKRPQQPIRGTQSDTGASAGAALAATATPIAGAHIKRPPVVTVLGHIDHGKSTLLDYIRQTSIVDHEAGGITQSISAYEVERVTRDESGAPRTERITFIDTPGHEAFSGMRERGAGVADIAILVVSAEDGVKPQTIEAYKEIEKAKVPFVVAINKIDKPAASIDRTKTSLAEAGIYVEGYGGNVSFVPISAKTGEGIDDLLDIVVLTADIAELRGDPSKPAEGVVIEAHRDPKKGISATLVIKDGALNPGMFVACGTAYSPTRILENYAGKKISGASFSSPIRLVGWSKAPEIGGRFVSFKTKKELEAHLEEAATRERKLGASARAEALSAASSAAGTVDPSAAPLAPKKAIPVVIKADVQGSVEAIEHEIAKIQSDRVELKVVLASIGDITESDIKAVSGDKEALVAGFNVRTDSQAKALIDRLGFAHATFDIIYNLREWLEKEIMLRTPKVQTDETQGTAKILKFFSRAKDKQIVGGKVTDREITLGHRVKISRRDTIIGEGLIRELQQAKVKTSSVAQGFEFGALIEASIELAPGDVIEDFITVEK